VSVVSLRGHRQHKKQLTIIVAIRSAVVGEEGRINAERRKILQRLASYEGDGLSEEETGRLEQRERENEYRRQLELERKANCGFLAPSLRSTNGSGISIAHWIEFQPSASCSC
jgi:hypothetical protein